MTYFANIFQNINDLYHSSYFTACGGGGGDEPAQGAGPTPIPATKNIVLNWNPPTKRTDGSLVSSGDIADYKLHYGTSSSVYQKVINVGKVSTYTLSSMTANTYYISVSAYDSNGVDSAIPTPQKVIVQ